MLALERPSRVDSRSSLAPGRVITFSRSFGLANADGVVQSWRDTLWCTKKPISPSNDTSAPLFGDRPFAMLSEFDKALVGDPLDWVLIRDDRGLPAPLQRGTK